MIYTDIHVAYASTLTHVLRHSQMELGFKWFLDKWALLGHLTVDKFVIYTWLGLLVAPSEYQCIDVYPLYRGCKFYT